MNQSIDCSLFAARLNAYLDSELSREEREAMNAHAAACPVCGEQLESMTRLLTMCAELDEGLSVPLEAQAAWRKAVRQEAAGQTASVSRRGSAFRRWVGGIAAALMLLTGGTFAYRANLAAPSGTAAVTYIAGQQTFSTEESGALFTNMRVENKALRTTAMVMEADGEVAAVPDTEVFEDAFDQAPSPDQDLLVNNPSVVLRTAERTIESTAFDQALKSVQDLVSEYQGYFEESTVSGQPLAQQGKGRMAEMIIRIPTGDLDDFLISLDAVGQVISSSESAEDISDRFYDVQARLESYRAQLDRLNQLMGTTADLEDMLLLEDKRTEVMQEIDSLEGQLNGWNSRAQRSTVHVAMREVQERGQVQPSSTDLTQRIRIAFYDSINWLKAFGQDCAVVLAMAAPALVIVIPAIILICLIISGIRRRIKRRKGK